MPALAVLLDQTGESYVPVHGRFQLHSLIEIFHSFHDSTLLGLCLYFFIRVPHGYSPFISLIRRSSRSSRTFFFSSHSQIISTFQPMSISFLLFCLSRSMFRLIFGPQYSVLEDGHTNRPQLCLCQKQPFTKIAV